MSIELKIPTETLTQPNVAEALADLIRALGGVGADKRPKGTDRKRRSEPRPTEPTMDWGAFVATLSPTTQSFLALLEAKGEVTMAQAVKHLKLKQNKAMGGLTGALSRKAARNGIALPFKQSQNRKGQRTWVWSPSA